MKDHLPRGIRAGFTLIELLVVVAIIAIALALIVPAFNHITDAWQLTSSANSLADGLRLAREQALSTNEPVEFRLYYMSPSGGGPLGYRGYSSFLQNNAGADVSALDKINYLSTAVITSTNPIYSSLYLVSSSGATSGTDSSGRKYVSFRFRPNGSTDLSTATPNGWFLTVLSEHVATTGTLPANFITLQVNPISGGVTMFRP